MKKPVGAISISCKDKANYNKFNVRYDWDFYKSDTSYICILNDYPKYYTLNEVFGIIKELLENGGEMIQYSLPKRLNREFIIFGLKWK